MGSEVIRSKDKCEKQVTNPLVTSSLKQGTRKMSCRKNLKHNKVAHTTMMSY
jgi:hypothetical protein